MRLLRYWRFRSLAHPLDFHASQLLLQRVPDLPFGVFQIGRLMLGQQIYATPAILQDPGAQGAPLGFVAALTVNPDGDFHSCTSFASLLNSISLSATGSPSIPTR